MSLQTILLSLVGLLCLSNPLELLSQTEEALPLRRLLNDANKIVSRADVADPALRFAVESSGALKGRVFVDPTVRKVERSIEGRLLVVGRVTITRGKASRYRTQSDKDALKSQSDATRRVRDSNALEQRLFRSRYQEWNDRMNRYGQQYLSLVESHKREHRLHVQKMRLEMQRVADDKKSRRESAEHVLVRFIIPPKLAKTIDLAKLVREEAPRFEGRITEHYYSRDREDIGGEWFIQSVEITVDTITERLD